MKEIILTKLMETDITFEEMEKVEQYLNELERNQDFLYALQAAGVDNWSGYDEAKKIYNEEEE